MNLSLLAAQRTHGAPTPSTACSRASSERGFTLIELLTVVAIVGILATLGLVSYRKFITSAKTSEAIYMVGTIKAAEESYRAETLSYLNVTTGFTSFYPTGTVGATKTAWDSPSHADYTRWRQLGARADGPVYYGYKVAAGAAGAVIPVLTGLATPPTWGTPSQPWYVIFARGDIDGDGTYSYVAGSSFTSEIYVENEGE